MAITDEGGGMVMPVAPIAGGYGTGGGFGFGGDVCSIATNKVDLGTSNDGVGFAVAHDTCCPRKVRLYLQYLTNDAPDANEGQQSQYAAQRGQRQ